MPKYQLLPLLLLLTTLNTHALQSVCFSQAETYYEQLYCEVKEEDPEAVLPSFADFRRNPPLTQALLLKRKAASLGITVKMPTADDNKARSTARVTVEAETKPITNQAPCTLEGQRIRCGAEAFVQRGNLANPKLPAQALGQSNQLRLQPFSGNQNDNQHVLGYLTGAYVTYLDSMLSIGLAGETMSFTKFYYLFKDVTSKGADFAQRFQTMFEYLKKDKQNISISESIAEISGIGIEQCERLSERMFTCDNTRRNAVFLKE